MGRNSAFKLAHRDSLIVDIESVIEKNCSAIELTGFGKQTILLVGTYFGVLCSYSIGMDEIKLEK